jgi:hypothetical protein
MPIPSNAREFFDRILGDQDQVAAIRRLIDQNNPTYETYWLDFKGEEQPKPGRTPEPKLQEKSNRRAWSEYLSAFANTGGGVMLWGIDARRKVVDGREIDFAGDEALVTDPTLLASKLREWQGQATDPPLSGVEIHPYPVPEDQKKGFVLCFIPEGPYKPYQSIMTDDKQYYIRGGTSNFVMVKPTLASLFYPKTKPIFRLIATAKLEMQHAARDNARSTAHVQVELFNRGTSSAKDISAWIHAETKGTPTGPLVKVNERWVLKDEGTRWDIWSRGLPLHPGQRVPLFAAETSIFFRIVDGLKPNPGIHLDIELFCENQERQVFNLEIEGEELEDNVPHSYELDPEE